MLAKNKKNRKNKILLLAAIMLLLVSCGVIYYLSQAQNTQETKTNHPDTNLKPATTEQKDTGNKTKSTTANPDGSDPESPKNPSTPGNGQAETTVEQTASTQNGSIYQLRYLIGAVSKNGTCTLTLTNDARVVTKTAKTQALAQASTCQGFDIPTSELSPGVWNTNMVVSGDGLSGSTSSTIRIQ